MWKCNIEKLIDMSGLRKDYIAKKIGTSTRQLRKYEKFELFIPFEKGLLLAELLNCSVADFYERHESKEEKIKEYLDTPIELLDVGVRLFHILKRNHVNTYEDLLNKKDWEKIRGLGRITKMELDGAIDRVRRGLENLDG